jgi:hypothetical protein
VFIIECILSFQIKSTLTNDSKIKIKKKKEKKRKKKRKGFSTFIITLFQPKNFSPSPLYLHRKKEISFFQDIFQELGAWGHFYRFEVHEMAHHLALLVAHMSVF